MIINSYSKSISALMRGDVIVYPTDTLYGLGADIFNNRAVKKIFKLKKRPQNLPLSIAVSNIEEIEKLAYVNDITVILSRFFLPGKLTLILKKKKIISDIVSGGSKKIGIRIPNNKIALDIISNFGPITCTSANIHKCITPAFIKDIYMCFKDKVSVYLDDGKLDNPPSTIVDLTDKEMRFVREGAISIKTIRNAISNG
jgi:L-threonylcarbamoyladenylate synthase